MATIPMGGENPDAVGWEAVYMQGGSAKWFLYILYSAATLGGAWLIIRFLLPWAAPFLVSMGIAAALEPLIRKLERRGWKRSLASGLCSLAVLGLVVWAAVALTSRGVSVVTAFARRVPELMSAAGKSMDRIENSVLAYIGSAPEEVAAYLKTGLKSVADGLYSLPGLLSQRALDLIGWAAQKSPSILLFIITAGIGTYFVSAAFPNTMAFIAAQLPRIITERLEGLGHNLKSSFGGFLRAQGILMAMTFFELLLGFFLLGVDGAFGLAALIAVIDALPVFGTGIVLVPWALFALLLGDLRRGVGLLLCWGVVNIVRSCAQAKLLGDQIGLDPLASLLAIYVGWRVWGVWGMLTFPIILVTIQQLNDRGVVHLWKSI